MLWVYGIRNFVKCKYFSRTNKAVYPFSTHFNAFNYNLNIDLNGSIVTVVIACRQIILKKRQ